MAAYAVQRSPVIAAVVRHQRNYGTEERNTLWDSMNPEGPSAMCHVPNVAVRLTTVTVNTSSIGQQLLPLTQTTTVQARVLSFSTRLKSRECDM